MNYKKNLKQKLFINCLNFFNLQNHLTFNSEERLVNLLRGRECFVGLSVLIFYNPDPRLRSTLSAVKLSSSLKKGIVVVFTASSSFIYIVKYLQCVSPWRLFLIVRSEWSTPSPYAITLMGQSHTSGFACFNLVRVIYQSVPLYPGNGYSAWDGRTGQHGGEGAPAAVSEPRPHPLPRGQPRQPGHLG